MDQRTVAWRETLIIACVLIYLLAFSAPIPSQQPTKVKGGLVLRIGTGGPLTGAETDSGIERGGRALLQSFIHEHTGLDCEVVYQEDWQALAEELENGRLQMGIFQGHEFAWAQVQHSRIRPLVLAINTCRYPVASVVVLQSNPASDFAGLEGQSLDIPRTALTFPRQFIRSQSQHYGKPPETYFSMITAQANVEDALDDVVDGKTQCTVADRVVLESYERRKPGRFKQLREVARSQPFPPMVLAYSPKTIGFSTLLRFQVGFKDAKKDLKGETIMMLLRLAAVEQIPADFSKVLAQTREECPPPTVAVSSK